MIARVRHKLFLPQPLSDRLEVLAAKPGASKSAILDDAVAAWLDRRAGSELDDRFGLRLDRLSAALARLERDSHVTLESLALFIRFELTIQAPLAENDAAGRALVRERFEAFVTQVSRHVASGRRSLGSGEVER